MRIIFFGTPEFAVPSLQALIESGEEVVAVVTQPDKVKGRGHKLSRPPIKELAISRGIPIMQPSGIRTPEFFDEIARPAPDIIVVVAYGRLIPAALLKLPPMGCVNVHASLLPQYRGAAPIQWALINGEEKTGITTMLMDEGLDTGAVLLKEEVAIHEEDNAYTLGRRLSQVGASLLIKTLKAIETKMIIPAPQSGEASYAPPLKKENGKINWALSAREISNLIMGTFPWPGAYCYLHGEKINIIKAKVVPHNNIKEFINKKTSPSPSSPPLRGGDEGEGGICGFTYELLNKGTVGRIGQISGSDLLVITGSGILAISEVKPAGKNIMSASAFMHGRHLKEGAIFDAV
ncbi:MAG: methionyl-tRNA formyltransferase [Nitrospira bacterium HGW-Nitrospira-1]|nr:MAG: methionyl-tRNA formyltransferase [Nitrospira bacterium HGW-Nitrospira-1]